MNQAAITVDSGFRVAEVDPRLFGSFVEHLGRCVYEGLYEPSHPSADAAGFRGDVAELVRELGVPVLRYPGGNFVSAYTWEDGIGPVDERPVRLDLAWRSLETNRVGVDEFAPWCQTVGSAPMMAVNLGTRGVDEARALVEYCNVPSGTAWSDLRRRNGAADPYDIKLWCLGNEMDGPWQIGHKSAREYGRLAASTGIAMRRVDPTIELVACGSSYMSMPTFSTWERTVLEECYQVADYVSMHSYYEQRGDDRDSFLGSAVQLDRFIDSCVATCDHVRAVGRHTKRMNLALDEWNVWYQRRFRGEESMRMVEAPHLFEDAYNVTDAVVVGDLLITMMRHADRLHIGCLAQLVNAIAPIQTVTGGAAWRQTTFHPFALTSRYGRGTVLRVEPKAPVMDTSWLGEIPALDATAVHDEETGVVTVFAVNRNRHEPVNLAVDVRSFPELVIASTVALFDDDPDAFNSAARPDRVAPRTLDETKVEDGRFDAVLPPLSWNMIRLLPEQAPTGQTGR